jgi:hypothetical protein
MGSTVSGGVVRQAGRFGVFLGAFILMFSPLKAWAWGCEGHQAVAMIAEKHMTAHALEMANKLLRSEPIDPTLSRFCTEAAFDLMADSATWPDDIRKIRPEASPWHYIDIPRDAHRGPLSDFCQPQTGCVTSALAEQINLLRNDATDPRVRADALRFIIHFVGDLHQPMHCVTNNDEGGNCVPINFFGNPPIEKNPQNESYSPNLHSIWDYGVIQKMKGSQSISQWAASLDAEFSAQDGAWQAAGVNIDDWVWEGHELADKVAYPKLPVAIPVETPVHVASCADDNHVSTRMLKLDERVLQAYVDAVGPTINEQIAKAGVRLAMILNQIWP